MWHRLLGWWVLVVVISVGCSRAPQKPVVSGTVEADEIHVASRTGGRVSALHFREGDSVNSGQLIAELEAPELVAQRKQAAAQLAEWEAGPRPQELSEAQAEVDALEAQLRQAREDARRSEELFSTGVNTVSERDRLVSVAQTLARRGEAARQRLELLKAGTRSERLDQAKAHLAQLDAQVSELRVTAPTAAVLEVLPVRVGDVLMPGREVATLILSQQPWVRVYVPQPWLGHIGLGDEVQVLADAFPGKELTGTVEQIQRHAEFTPRNVQTPSDRIRQVFGVKIRLKAEDQIRAGMSVDVIFPKVPVDALPQPSR